jgi:hypothetical protein
VAPSVAGSVLSASVSASGGAPQSLTPDPIYTPWLSLNPSPKFPTQTALDTAAPVGNYNFIIQTKNEGQKNATLNLPSETFPPAPHISNWSEAQNISPGADFRLTWDPFVGGTTNDLILVLVGDQSGTTIYLRTPGPLEPGALNGTDSSVIIPANTLQANTTYAMEITFFKVKSTDTTSYAGATGIVGFESFTDSSLTTSSASFGFSFRQLASGGSFLGDTNATPSFPVVIGGYRAELIVSGTTNFPAPANVLITGPLGSGLTNTATFLATSGNSGFYFTPEITQPPIPLAGTWSANYAGPVYDFPEPDLQVEAHLVVPVPSVGLSNGLLQNTTWSYYDTNGNVLAGTPAFLTSIQMQVLNTAGALIYNSEVLAAATQGYSFTNSLSWTNVGALRFLYEDTMNSYIVGFSNVTVASAAPIKLTVLDVRASGFAFLLTGQAGRAYQIQFSSDLSHWTNWITTNLPTATIELTDPQPANPLLFYRARLVN